MPGAPTDLAHWPSLALDKPQQTYRWCLFGPEQQEVIVDKEMVEDLVAAAFNAGPASSGYPDRLFQT